MPMTVLVWWLLTCAVGMTCGLTRKRTSQDNNGKNNSKGIHLIYCAGRSDFSQCLLN